jgi:hypothetical protein
MNKTRLHEILWFPYRPEHSLIVLIVIWLLLAVASYGVVESVDIFMSYDSSKATANPWLLALLLFSLCCGLCILSARSDYIVWYYALFPCLVTVCLLSVIFWVLAGSPMKQGVAAAIPALVSVFVSLGVIARFVQSSGEDLGKVGIIWGRAKSSAGELLRTPVDGPEFVGRRSTLTTTLEALAKALTEAAPSVTKPERFEGLSTYLTQLVGYGKRADHHDFLREIREKKGGLLKNLSFSNEGV